MPDYARKRRGERGFTGWMEVTTAWSDRGGLPGNSFPKVGSEARAAFFRESVL
jgi:hypothetical protein